MVQTLPLNICTTMARWHNAACLIYQKRFLRRMLLLEGTFSDICENLLRYYLFSKTKPSAVWSMVIGLSRLTSSARIFLLRSLST